MKKQANPPGLDRTETLAIIKKVSKALAARDVIPVFSCLCFTDHSVYAYDDAVALEYPADLKLRGGVRGNLLLDFLSSAGSKTLDVETKPIADDKGYEITLKAGRSKLTTTALPESDFLFQRSKPKNATVQKIDVAFLTAVNQAAVSLGQDTKHPWRLGVTVAFGTGGATLYSSDDKSITRATIGKPQSSETVAILPPRFIELLTSIGATDPPDELTITKQWAEVKFNSGLKLFSRTIDDPQPDNFQQVLAAKPKAFIPIPEGFDKCLRTAQVVIPYASNPFTKITIQDGKMRFKTESAAGPVTDSIDVGADHPKVSVDVLPDILLRALPYASKMAITDNMVAFRGAGFSYLVSVIQRTAD